MVESHYHWDLGIKSGPLVGVANTRRYSIREAKARPSNTAVRELLGNDAYTEAVLSFLRGTDAGKVKSGVSMAAVESTKTVQQWPLS